MRVVAFIALVVFTTVAHAQPFTYQGELKQDGIAASGPHDFFFRVFNQAADGAQVGAAMVVTNANVDDGRFTVQIDPGPGVFTGEDRWLQIDVRPAGAGGFTTLSPRQRLTPAPYAVRSLNEWLVPTFSDTLRNDSTRPRLFINRDVPITIAEYFGITTPTAGESFGGMYVNTQSAQGRPFYGYASAGVVRSYTFHDSVSNQWRLTIGGMDRLAVTAAGDVGIGTLTPAQRLDVAGIARAENFRYAAPRQRVMSLPSSAFIPRTPTSPSIVESNQGLTYYDASVGTGSFIAPLILPDGAVLGEVVGYFRDNSNAVDLNLSLLSRTFTSTTYSVIGSGTTSGASPAIQAVTIPPGGFVIDNSTRTYIISVFCSDWEGIDTAISAVRVTYTVAEPD